MTRTKNLFALVLVLFASSTRSIHADMIQAQTLLPSLNPSYVFTEDAIMDQGPKNPDRQHPRLFFQAEYHFVNDALVDFTGDRSSRIGTVLKNIHALELGTYLQPYRNFSFGATTSIELASTTNRASQTGVGDTRLMGKLRILGSDHSTYSAAIIPELRLPTGSQSLLFMTNDSVGVGVLLAVERDFGDFRISGNIGYRNASNAVYETIDFRQQIPLALGMLYSFNNRWALDLEGVGALSVPAAYGNSPAELYMGARHAMSPDAAWVAGVGVGSWDGVGIGNFRAMFGLKFTPVTWIADKNPESN